MQKVFLKFYKSLCLWPATLFKKRLLQLFEFCEMFKDMFFTRAPLLVASVFFFYAGLLVILY